MHSVFSSIFFLVVLKLPDLFVAWYYFIKEVYARKLLKNYFSDLVEYNTVGFVIWDTVDWI